MRLARKLTIALALGILTVMVVNGYVRVQRESRLFESERASDERLLGMILRASLEAIRASQGDEHAVDLIARANDAVSEVQFRWIWLDGPGAFGDTVLSAERGRALMSDGVAVRTTTDDRVYLYIPVGHGQHRPAALEISESLGFEQSFLRQSVLQSVATTLGITAVCGLIAMGLGVLLVGRPVRRLYEQTRRIGRGDFSQRLSIYQRDEIGDLAHEIDAMCDQLVAANGLASRETESRIAALEQLRHADRLKTVGQLASGVAHELGTPINVVSGYARVIAREPEALSNVVTGARVIVEQSERMATIIRQLLDFARRRTPKLETWDLALVARDTIRMLMPLARKKDVDLVLTAGPQPILAKVDRFQAQQVLTNLTMNAIQAVSHGGHVEIEVSRGDRSDSSGRRSADDQFVRVAVKDDGSGIAEEAVPRVFEPFFTTKGVGEGTGLGLSVAYGIVQEHGGRIDVESRAGAGTKFCVYFHRVGAEAEEAT